MRFALPQHSSSPQAEVRVGYRYCHQSSSITQAWWDGRKAIPVFPTWKLGPPLSDLETGSIIEFGSLQRKRNASHVHQTASNWGGGGENNPEIV